ncbi:hypothetical protein [Coralloluteibacterium stylophorae]|uniref:DUF2167 domain-containing protein n=1 Tax=Coralloluteibacterium stylophorae TaxID=1776034 RepID=A0A8J8AZ45_9GAMM|nr:hypothetical protein [Coralloluteibacterium stylophorae]MBS7456518.1 hypothetical protein [Coralloluteibacterium stylophorae]
MLRWIPMLAALLLVTAARAAPVPLEVGGETIPFPADAGYVRASEAAPELFEFSQAALPEGNRLVEAFYLPEDIERLKRGEAVQDVYFQVQTSRSAENAAITLDEWQDARPELVAGMQRMDREQFDETYGNANARLSRFAGNEVEVRFGELGMPSIYEEDERSLRFQMVMPVEMRVGDSAMNMEIAAAGAVALVRNRMLYIYAFVPAERIDSTERIRQRLDRVVDGLTGVAPAADVDTAGDGIAALPDAQGPQLRTVYLLIGVVVLVVVALLVWAAHRRRDPGSRPPPG